MSQQPSGWYDDPSNPDMLRYWDGVTWTTHTAPKKSPTASQSTIGLPQQQAPQVPQAPTTPVPQGSGWQTQGPQQTGGAPQYPSQQQQYQQFPPYQQAPPNAQWMQHAPLTVDGVPLASWGKRFGAWVIDGIILVALAYFVLRLTSPAYFDTVQRFVDAMTAGDRAAIDNLVADMSAQSIRAGLWTWVTTAVYCIAFWTTRGQTPGKMAVGISVRRADRPGPLDLATAVRRRLLSTLQIIPVVSGLYVILWILDGLWPLWDAQRQALHDKVASTQVVEGRSPRQG